MSHNTCQYDSGSITGCRPACAAPATVTLRVTNPGMGHTYDIRVCCRHVAATRGRCHPNRVEQVQP